MGEKPIVLGGLLAGESKMGFLQLRVKKHRWHKQILKTNDVLLLSAGWRRFQTMPIFAIEDRNNKRTRMLKYTPEHMHCLMTVYGPLLPPNSGIVAFKHLQEKAAGFRIAGTGNVLEAAANFKI